MNPVKQSRTSAASTWMLSLLLLALPAAAQAQFRFLTNNGAITITGYTGHSGSVAIPGATNGLSVTTIGNNAFSLSTSLTNITIPATITNIGSLAFQLCTGLTNIYLPGSVLTVGSEAFLNCKNLATITVDPTNSFYSALDGVLFNKNQTLLVEYPAGKTGNYTVPGTVTNLGANAFDSCTRLAGVTIPSSVTSISLYAFEMCGLTNLLIPNSVTNIAQSAFEQCSSLAGVSLPGGVRYIGLAAFEQCSNLAAITVDPTNAFYSSTPDGVLFNKSQTRLIQYPGGRAGAYAVPAGVTDIGVYAFDGSVNLTNVALSGSVTNIENPAFFNCPGLMAITVDPASVSFSSVDGVLFDRYQTQLFQFPGGRPGNYTVPSTVTQIRGYAFATCPGLTNVTIPASVTNIAAWTFIQSPNLAGVYFQGGDPAVGSDLFDNDNQVTAYYLPGQPGWGSALSGIPAVPWAPGAQINDGRFGVRTNRFGFDIAGSSNLVIVVETSTNLGDSSWTPVSTNTLNTFVGTNGTAYFSDPQWTNYPGRFYRLRSP